jgi:hypothetical protein
MGVTKGCIGGYTLVCNSCMGFTEYEISPEEYDENSKQWDDWECPECRPNEPASRDRSPLLT